MAAGDDVLNICFHGIGTPQRQLQPGEDAYWVDTERLQCPQPVPRQHGDRPGYYRVLCDRTGQHGLLTYDSNVGRAVAAERDRSRWLPDDLPGSSPTAGPHRPGETRPSHPRTR